MCAEGLVDDAEARISRRVETSAGRYWSGGRFRHSQNLKKG